MIYIQKGKAPDSLTAYKKKKHAYFDGCNKDDIRDNLLREQGCLCVYCMRKINKSNMKIEHWKPECVLSEYERLDYHNMFGVCAGHKEGQKGAEDTCDTHKGNESITVDPRDKRTIDKIKYKSKSGEIYSDDAEIQKDLSLTLNLNSKGHRLAENRKVKLNAVVDELSKQLQKGIWSKEQLMKFLNNYSQPDSNGEKKEYLGIVQWYLQKKIH